MTNDWIDTSEGPFVAPKILDPHACVCDALDLFESGKVFVTFDLETTGRLNKEDINHRNPKGRVMQVAARRYERQANGTLKLTDEMNELINEPTMTYLNPQAFAAHGITLEDCYRKGLAPQIVWRRFLDMCDGAILVGQNILRFDIPFANREIARHGFHEELSFFDNIDMLLVVRQVWNFEENRLRALANLFKVKTDPSKDHDALSDIDTCWQVWQKIVTHDGMRAYKSRFIRPQPNQYSRVIKRIVF